MLKIYRATVTRGIASSSLRVALIPLMAISVLGGCAGLKPRGTVDQDVLLGRRLTQRGIDALDRGLLSR